MKKNWFGGFLFLLLIVGMAVLLLHDLFQMGVYSSHDGEVHMARLAQFIQALQDGNFPVRWLRYWNNGWGYPTFVYVYQLPYWMGTVLYRFIPNVEIVFKLLMWLSLAGSGVSFFVWVRKHTPLLSAFLASVMYMGAPYRMADIYERGALGEALFFVVAPLLFLVSDKGSLLVALVTFAALTTHALTFGVFFVPLIIYVWITKKKRGDFFKFLVGIGLGAGLAGFQLLPMIGEQKYVRLDITYYQIFTDHFVDFGKLLRLPGVDVGTGIQLGIVQGLILAVMMVVVVKEWRKINVIEVFFVIVSLVAMLLILPLSKILWEKTLFWLLFPWRFLTLTTFTTAALGGFLFTRFALERRWWIIPIILLAMLYPSRHFWRGARYHSFPQYYYATYTDPLRLDTYVLPRGVDDVVMATPPELKLLSGKGSVALVERTTSSLTVGAVVYTFAAVQFPIMYFPGWNLTIDGKTQPIAVDYPGLHGVIVGLVPEGKHTLKLQFGDTSLRAWGGYLSLVSVVIMLILVGIEYRFLWQRGSKYI